MPERSRPRVIKVGEAEPLVTPELAELLRQAEAKASRNSGTLPEMASRGVPIVSPDPQPEIRRNAEQAPDWEFREQAQFLYRWAVVFKERLLDPVLLTDRRRLPDPVISFDAMRIETLAAYSIIRNPQGLLDEITFNTVHLLQEDKRRVWEYGQWGELETLLHEQVHLWQQNFGSQPVKLGKVYHNKEFVAKCESLGLHPRPGVGSHWRPADGLFAMLMKEYGIAQGVTFEVAEGKRSNWWEADKERKGRSTLSKWSCGCQNARVGTKEFHAQCLKCRNVFVKVDELEPAHTSQTVFDAGAAEQRMSWKGDQEGIYQPRLHADRIHELHELVVRTGEPMTTLVDLALREFYERLKTSPPAGEGHPMEERHRQPIDKV
jgi:hypothetical protein